MTPSREPVFTESDLERVEALAKQFVDYKFGSRTILALLSRLECAERVIERMEGTHYVDCAEVEDLGDCDCGTDLAVEAWRRSKGEEEAGK